MGLTNQIPSSRLIQPGVITNASERPASPYEGQVIYQKDTDQLLVWNGTAWYPNWNQAWGIIGYKERTSIFTFSTTMVDVTNMSITFTAVAGRLYRVSYSFSSVYAQTANARVTIQLADSANTRIDQVYNDYPVADADQTISRYSLYTFSAGSKTLKLRAQIDSGTGDGNLYADSESKSVFMVEDIGPA